MSKKRKTSAGTVGQDVIVPDDAPSQAFVEGLVNRGEAVKVEPGGKLPPGATHEIVGATEAGMPIVRRKRFSAF